MNTRNFLLTIIVAIAAVLFIIFMWMQNSAGVDLSKITPTTTPEQTTMTPETSIATSTIKLAMLDTAQVSNGPSRGCDKVVMVTQQIPNTTAPLTAAMNTLFGISTTSVDGWFNYIPRTSGTLHFDHATVMNGVASIYLTGSLSGLAGVCDDPRTEIQTQETARQFPSVQSVQLYLNNTAVDTLAPSMK